MCTAPPDMCYPSVQIKKRPRNLSLWPVWDSTWIPSHGEPPTLNPISATYDLNLGRWAFDTFPISHSKPAKRIIVRIYWQQCAPAALQRFEHVDILRRRVQQSCCILAWKGDSTACRLCGCQRTRLVEEPKRSIMPRPRKIVSHLIAACWIRTFAIPWRSG